MIRFALVLLILLPIVSAADQIELIVDGPEGISLLERHLVEGSRSSLSKAAAAIDWTISESVPPSRFDQRNPSISEFPDGNWLVVWDDTRAGSKKIFGCKYDAAGTPLGDDQLIIGSTVGNNDLCPKVAIDSTGAVHLFYRNATTGLILGAILDSNLASVVPEFLINDTSLQSFAGDFDAAIYPSGRSVIVWENCSGFSTTIEMAIIDSIGNSVLAPTTANSGGGGFSRFDPAVAVDPTGDYLIAWDDRRNLQPDIFVRLFNGGGVDYDADENILPLPATTFDQYETDAAFAPTGDFVISWIDSRGGGQAFAKRYNRVQGQIGTDILISDSLATADNSGTVVTSNPDSTYWVTWASSTPQPNILRIRLDSTLNPISAITQADSLPINQKFEPEVNSSDSTVLMGWELVESSNADIVVRLFDSSGSPLMTSEVVANTDTSGAASVAPTIVAVQEGIISRALIAFADERNGSFGIWLQEIDKSGAMSTGNRLVSQDISGSHQDEPAIDIAFDTALIVWLDSRVVNLTSGLRLFGRYVDKFGQPLASEFLISDSNLASVFGQPSVALNNQTKALTAWVDQRISIDSLRIYGRWIDQNGLFSGAEFELSTSTDSSCTDLNLDCDSAGNFYAAWMDKGKDTAAVSIQWYSGDGSLSGSMQWRPANDSLSVEQIAADVSDDGQIALLWVGLDDERQVYLTVLDTTGSIIVADLLVTSSALSFPTDPVISYSETGYLLTGWIDRRDGVRRMYHQLYDDSYTPVDPNTAVSSEPVETMEYPALAAVAGRVWFSWVDPRADGQNVFANSYVFLATGVDKDDPNLLPNHIELSQNFPNPFNPETRIRFSLTRKSLVSIDIFNLLGRQVRHLVNREYSAGQYEVVWEGRTDGGTEVASGLYLYRLKVGEMTESKKMLLLK